MKDNGKVKDEDGGERNAEHVNAAVAIVPRKAIVAAEACRLRLVTEHLDGCSLRRNFCSVMLTSFGVRVLMKRDCQSNSS